jgi:glycosyltransferase involved in cell wall biosynthesis
MSEERADTTAIDLSVVIPAYNEAESILPLTRQVSQVLGALGSYEIVFVDDGSTDGTVASMRKAAAECPSVRIIRFRRNFGKSAALTAGFAKARGRVVITMDADLQDDPEEIPRLLQALDENDLDLVSGWKWPRLDPLSKTLPSRVFNRVTAWTTGVNLHDFNCGFKAYRRQVIKEVSIRGELHRYIPVLAYHRGFRVGEIQVHHNPRQFGKSKYGARRFVRGFFDLLTVLFLTRYRHRPLHLLGWPGLASGVLGVLTLAYLSVLWMIGERPIGNRPLLSLGVLLVVVGAQFLSMGLVAEMILSHNQDISQQEYAIVEESDCGQ